ncbi:MAG: hypothetical protein PF495_21100 [Spirochaetales bacterium]|jgi:hypothetical protein|nr:hypothetical protein [Spirochaetales bacterium]
MEWTVDIELFRVLDEVKTALGLQDKAWAKASGLSTQSRISELRQAAHFAENGHNYKVGRAFTMQKCINFYEGLVKLEGLKRVKEEIVKRLDQVSSSRNRLHLMTLIINKQENIDLLEKMMTSLLEAEISQSVKQE